MNETYIQIGFNYRYKSVHNFRVIRKIWSTQV